MDCRRAAGGRARRCGIPCRLPPAGIPGARRYRPGARRARPQPPLWLNLEYLSAEDWVEGCHGLPSPQPKGLRKVFFFPGFTDKTGGLLREGSLLARRDAFQQSADARRAFLLGLGVDPVPGALLISLFAYENPQLGNWLDALATADQSCHLLVPQGRIVAGLSQWLGEGPLHVGDVRTRGALTVQVLPFVSQDDFDRLLWSCDFNAVRGEDSFVRAQWAGQPMLWHIYVQDENAHWEKLEAFLAHYRCGLSDDADAALLGLWRAWNMNIDMGQAWRAARQHWPELQQHARRWGARQAAQPDLAEALVHFYRNSL